MVSDTLSPATRAISSSPTPLRIGELSKKWKKTRKSIGKCG